MLIFFHYLELAGDLCVLCQRIPTSHPYSPVKCVFTFATAVVILLPKRELCCCAHFVTSYTRHVLILKATGLTGFVFHERGSKCAAWFQKRCTLRDCIFVPQLNWILASFGLLHGVRWFVADVSELPIGPVFKNRVSKKKAGANQSGSLWAKTCASWRPLVCLAIAACDRIAALSNRHLNYNWGWAYANGCPWWSS
jgi:hypothetical protein